MVRQEPHPPGNVMVRQEPHHPGNVMVRQEPHHPGNVMVRQEPHPTREYSTRLGAQNCNCNNGKDAAEEDNQVNDSKPQTK